VFCALSKEIVYGPFFMGTAITGVVYLDMLEQFLIPQLNEDDKEGRIHFRQDSAPLRHLGEVREYLSTRVGTSYMSDTWHVSVASQRLIDFILW
jgi:hypothetical protein